GICHRFTSTDQLMPGCIAGEPRDGEVGASCRLRLTGPLREDTSASAAYSTLLLTEALQSTVDRQASAA
ncbi:MULTISPECIES: hypothetical protein, partial [unclassified Bradyrhizobium]|uniref:hypothetical protein n=1 Tax=unclassified Bradyrhizobium TaxID=2631580 RepID=UPI001FFA4622